MQFFRYDWILLFQETKHIIAITNSLPHIVCGDCIIIDHINLSSNHVSTILHYFSCVIQVLIKHILPFKLSKLDFFQPRVECIGYDLPTRGNFPVASKLYLLQSYPFLPHGILLLSFIGLCCFYNRYYPSFETNIKSLRKLQRLYHRNGIPIMG